MPSKWTLCVVPWDLYATYLDFRLSVRSAWKVFYQFPNIIHQRGRSRRDPLRSDGYTDLVNSTHTKCEVEGNQPPNPPGGKHLPFQRYHGRRRENPELDTCTGKVRRPTSERARAEDDSLAGWKWLRPGQHDALWFYDGGGRGRQGTSRCLPNKVAIPLTQTCSSFHLSRRSHRAPSHRAPSQ